MSVVLASALACLLTGGDADAAIVKSVQTSAAEETMPSSAAAKTVTLARPVDSSRSFVVCSARSTSGNADRRVTCELGDTQLVITQGTTDASTVVRWYVAEFESGVQVQRGVQALANSVPSAPVTLTEVDPSKSFVLTSERIASASANADENWTVRARLTSGTTLTLDRARTDAAAPAQVAWQVVQMEGAAVQRGTLCIGPAASCPLVGAGMTAGLSNGATLATAVDTAKSFVLLTRHGSTTINGVEALHRVRGDFTTTGTAVSGLTFRRVQTSTTATQRVEIAYEVVSLGDGSTVRRGQTGSLSSFAAATTTLTTPSFAAVSLARTVPFVSVAGGGSGANSHLDETSWTAAVNETTLTFKRLTSANNTRTTPSSLAWQAVEFFRCANQPLCDVGASAASGQATVSWSPYYDPECATACHVLVLRNTVSITDVPVDGTSYTAGQLIGTSRVVYSGAGASAPTVMPAPDTGLVNGTTYYYKVFAKTGAAYVTLAASISEVTAVPDAGNTAWSFTMTGGPAVNPPIAGAGGRVFVSSNAGKIVALDTATGASTATANTHGPVQGYVSWVPGAGGADTVLGADLSGFVYAVDAATGATRWSFRHPSLGAADYVQAGVSVQLRDFAGPAFQSTYASDVVYVGTRSDDFNTTGNFVYALRADTGALLWTFQPSATGGSMDHVIGQPWVDYARDRLYVATRNGEFGGQIGLWVIDTLTGALVTAPPGGSATFALGDFLAAPTVTFDNSTLYVASDDASVLWAINLDTLTLKWAGGFALGGRPKGFVWEGETVPRRLYLVTDNGTQDSIRCVQDDGATASQCWNRPHPVAGGRFAQPLIGWLSLYAGGSNGSLYEIQLTDGVVQKTHAITGAPSLGDASTDDGAQILIGSSGGRIYKIVLPLP